MKITILELYPDSMNLYGDLGNTLALKRRLEWRGFEVEIIQHNTGDKTNFNEADILIGGGGQDSSQDKIQVDLLGHASDIDQLITSGTPALMICGLYQLLGRSFVTSEGKTIKGAGILPIETRAGKKRLVGNIIIDSPEFGEIVGYENHSGRTFLDNDTEPLGQVVRGFGNNGADNSEGVRYHNLIASYGHGPLLPKNPKVADFLIAKALEKKGHTDKLTPLDIDKVAAKAHRTAGGRK